MTPAVSVEGLVKVYGSVRALDGVDLEVASGSVFGFLGPNGAGKTTTLRILTGLARPSAGQARVLGHDVARATGDVRADIGFLPDVPGFYEWMTAPEFLRFAGSLFGLGGRTLDERVGSLIDLAGLAGVTTRIGGYSRGMKQRLGIAQALVNAPALLLLDEPTSALDPIGRKEVLEMIASLAGRTTVFFSTHVLADVERVCDTVAVLNRGRVVAQAPITTLKSRFSTRSVLIEVSEGAEALAGALRGEPWVQGLEVLPGGAVSVHASDIGTARRTVPAIVARHGWELVRLEAGEPTLEEVFVDLVDGDV